MSGMTGEAAAGLRRGVYAVLIALAAGNMIGRLLAVNSVNRLELEQYLVGQRVANLERQLRSEGADEAAIAAAVAEARPKFERQERRERPFLSSNDRSRWLTVRALLEHATFAIDEVLDPTVWNSIDMVKHKGRDELSHLYSSKPPLFSVLLAGEYWLVSKATGWTLAENPHEVGRLMLLSVNVLPMLLMLALVAGWAERFGATDWGRIFVVAAASLGTLLTSFAVVLNNHLVAAVCTAVALEAFVRIWFDGERRLRWYALAGAAAAFAAADELPALSLLALLAAALLLKGWRPWLLGFAPAAGLVVAAFFGANYAAHASWRPPYMHRSASDPQDNWYLYEYTMGGKVRDSYWKSPQGIDRGEPSKWTYALHVLVGHHGVFSLTPVWVLSAWGAVLWLRGSERRKRELAAGIVLLSVVCAVFYIALRPQVDRNYGGMTCGFRWLLWLAPLWLAVMIPAADRLAKSRMGMTLACVLLVFSVLSASYPTWNPWTQPWIYNWMTSSGWKGF
jgi:hypothetical protein